MSEAYRALTSATLAGRLAGAAGLADRIGDPARWRVREVGDGNLNLVFIVEGPGGSAVVKQALPYARVVGESWPMSLDRAFFEHEALIRLAARDPGRLPRMDAFDRTQAIIVMEHLTPHVILRRRMIAGDLPPGLAAVLGTHVARTTFRGSDFAMETARRKADLALFAGNVELCGITEDLVFTDPYRVAPMNRHTPGLEAVAASIRADTDLKVAAQALKARFAADAQTLLHGDLHAGSVMVTDDDVRVIDAEFATYGPIGFDVGMLLGNYLLAAFAQDGLADRPEGRAATTARILDLLTGTWDAFAAEFARLWRTERTGIVHARSVFEDAGDVVGAERALARVLDAVRVDAIGFAGVEMIRRILGLAHVPELETIADEGQRAACEMRALTLGRRLVVEASGFDWAAVRAAAAAGINGG